MKSPARRAANTPFGSEKDSILFYTELDAACAKTRTPADVFTEIARQERGHLVPSAAPAGAAEQNRAEKSEGKNHGCDEDSTANGCADFADDRETAVELKSIENDPAEIEDRFYRDLEFGTAGMRGVLGAGTNRLNIYNVRRVTRALAKYILTHRRTARKRAWPSPTIPANKSDVFAKRGGAGAVRRRA